jgi:hypothetical protein
VTGLPPRNRKGALDIPDAIGKAAPDIPQES